MLDQNLLDKQFILESLIDLLEKSSNGLMHSQIPNQQQQQQQKSSNSAATSALTSSSLVSTGTNASSTNEFSTIKLILTTSLYQLLPS